MAQVFPKSLTKFWSDWDVRIMVLVSLILQIVLILLGNRRKYMTSNWLRLSVWLAYLSADWAATVSLSVISNSQNDEHDPSDPHYSITAFWAPFLLLHLGGPDTITAYSLEDNELWWRHFLTLVVQVGVAFYVFLTAWTFKVVNYISLPMFVIGTVKFGERIWVLRSASSEQFRKSPDSGPSYFARYMDECRLRKAEGYNVSLVTVTGSPALDDRTHSVPSAADLEDVHTFFKLCKSLFADHILRIHDIMNSQSFFHNRSSDEVFKVIEIELGFMYDVFYTKAVIMYTCAGSFLRCVGICCVVSASLSFLLTEKKGYSTADVIVTYTLLAGAVLLEIYAIASLLCSDWTMLSLRQGNVLVSLLYQAVSVLLPSKKRRWSNKMAQCNLIRYCLKDKPAKGCFRRKVLDIYDQFVEQYRYESLTVPEELKELIFQQILEKSAGSSNDTFGKPLCALRGEWALQKAGCLDRLSWSISGEFDRSILLWHIATDLCYSDCGKNNASGPNPIHTSKMLSDYMMYLLIKRPLMLPNGFGHIRFHDTCAEANELLTEGQSTTEESEACDVLRHNYPETPQLNMSGGRSSVIYDSCRLAKELKSMGERSEMEWKVVSNVWVEMLCYAASQCQRNQHAQQLRRGGELLTHVWLLMTHLGVTDQCQSSDGDARLRVVLE